MSAPDVSWAAAGAGSSGESVLTVWASRPSSPEWPPRSQGPLDGSAGHWKVPWTLSSVRGLGLALAELGEPGEGRVALSRAQVADSHAGSEFWAQPGHGAPCWLEGKDRDGEAEQSANLS